MISLTEYLQNNPECNYSGYDYLDERIIEHCRIHYRVNSPLFEPYFMTESNGAFPGEHDLVKNVEKFIKDNYKLNETVVFNADTKLVKDVYIKFKNDDKDYIDSDYTCDSNKWSDYNQIRWDDSKKQFIFVEITIYNYDRFADDVRELLYHEFGHMWDDYIDITTKGKFLSDRIKKSLTYKLNNKNIDETVKKLIYYSEDYEISAYIAQLNGVLKDKMYHSVKEAFDELVKKSPTYQNYKLFYIMVNDNEYIKILEKYISNKDIKKCQRNINQAWKKIVNHSYLICCEHNDGLDEELVTDKGHGLREFIVR